MSIHQQIRAYDPDRGYGSRFGLIKGWDGEPVRACLVCQVESIEVDGQERCTGSCSDRIYLCEVCGEPDCGNDDCEELLT